MDVFDLQRQVVSDYEKFTRSFTTIRAEDLRVQVEALYADGRFWPEPLIQINPRYKLGRTVAELAGSGELHPACLRIFRADGQPLHLFKHQEQSVALAGGGESFVVTTGTGSGKSLCFFIPIVHAVLSEGAVGEPRTRAVVVYPMNALANSQMEELEKFLSSAGNPAPITFGRYTGQDDREERQAIADHAPDILLTNFMMLELLMTRQDELDQKVIGNCAGLRFLVLDEFHTYRGRQGADVALLVRRVRDRLAGGRLQCIGTSATMASGDSAEEKARVIAEVASRLFAAPIAPYHVVSETLERTTDPEQTADSVAHELAPVIEAGFPDQITDAELTRNPLVIWVETRLGLDWSTADNKWVRARPQRMTDAIGRLAQESGGSAGDCRAAIEKLLLLASRPERERMGGDADGRPGFFAFKLHQFISGAGHAYATLDPLGHRAVLVEGQQFLPQAPEKRLYSTHFCRECGQEYHPSAS